MSNERKEFVTGKGGTYYTPFPVLAFATDGGQTFMTAGGGGASCTKEVPNILQAHKYDEETGKPSTIACLNTEKQVVVYLSHCAKLDLWLASLAKGCMVLKLNEEKNSITKLCQWDTEHAGKEPEQNFAKFSSDGTMIVTGGTDGFVQVWKVGESLEVQPTLLRTCGEKSKEILDGDFSGNNQLLATCDKLGDATVWDLNDDDDKKGTVLTHTTNMTTVKGRLFVKFVTFLSGADGQPALILSSSGARGPGVIAVYDLKGVKAFEVVVDKAEPLKSVSLDVFCGRLVVGTMSGGKNVYSVPTLAKIIKQPPGIHTLPSQAVGFLGENTAVSVSGDRSINFLDCRVNVLSKVKDNFVYLVFVIIALMFAFHFLLNSMGDTAPSGGGPAPSGGGPAPSGSPTTEL